MIDRDLVPVCRVVGQKLRDRVIDRQFAALLQEHYRGARKLFRNRSHAEYRVGRDWNAMLDVGQTVSSLVHDLAAVEYHDRGARPVAGVGRFEIVACVVQTIRVDGQGEQCDCNHTQSAHD